MTSETPAKLGAVSDNPRIVTGITVSIVLMLFTLLLLPDGRSRPQPAPAQAFFTIDDGFSWFADDAKKVPPFKKLGKDAVRAMVYSCDGRPFVNHLERKTARGLELKLPGAGEWVHVNDAEAQAIMKPRCPNPQAVVP